jgi:hypothetical protein
MSPRMHGESPQEYAQRRAFELERKQTKPMELQSNTVLVSLPCECDKWPFPHYHAKGDERKRQ